jgi:hypothetical protein
VVRGDVGFGDCAALATGDEDAGLVLDVIDRLGRVVRIPPEFPVEPGFETGFGRFCVWDTYNFPSMSSYLYPSSNSAASNSASDTGCP